MTAQLSHQVDHRWIPTRFAHCIWTTFEDTSLIEEGTIFFNPARYAHYAGEVEKVNEANGKKFALIRWYKGADNIIYESIEFSRFDTMYLWWIDPCMQPDE